VIVVCGFVCGVNVWCTVFAVCVCVYVVCACVLQMVVCFVRVCGVCGYVFVYVCVYMRDLCCVVCVWSVFTL